MKQPLIGALSDHDMEFAGERDSDHTFTLGDDMPRVLAQAKQLSCLSRNQGSKPL